MVDRAYYVNAGAGSIVGHFCNINTEDIVLDIKTAIYNGYKTILFDNTYEAVYFDIIKKIHRIVNIINVPDIEYIYFCSAQNGIETYSQFCKENNITEILKILSVSVFENTTKEYLVDFYNKTNYPVIEYKQGIKPKLFCCFNKAVREHRIGIFYNILKNQLLGKTYSSFYYGKEVTDRLRQSRQPEMFKMFKKYYNIFPLTLNMPNGRDNPVDVRIDDLKYHANSYFSLVTETLFFKNDVHAGNSIFLTEKTFRPVIHKHPFILVSTANSLTHLRKLGYKTFSPYINEHYDTIENDEDRFNAVWAEVERLCAFSNSEWLEWQKGIVDIVNYNYEVLTTKTDYLL